MDAGTVNDIAVVIPTLRRPDELRRALRSVFAQVRIADRLREIVVVDNDPSGSARETVAGLASEAPWPVIYRHAPQPGVATARNAGLAATQAPLIAFLDDDEAAAPDWLAALARAHHSLGADVTFGPIRGRAPETAGWARDYLERFFGRSGPETDRLVDEPFGCGNSMMTRATALVGPAPFDPAADSLGGEDDVLFADLQARGARFGWAADAWVDEYAPAHRANLRYALTRAFAYGQGPSQTAARSRDWAGVARWMVIGAGQALVFGVAAAGLAAVASPRCAEALDRAARGAGKLFWMNGLEPRFYGTHEVTRLDRVSARAVQPAR